jgi:hypothetical protein
MCVNTSRVVSVEWKFPASIVFASVTIATFWLSSLLGDIFPIRTFSTIHYLFPILCGMILYLHLKELTHTFYAVGITCLLASLLVTLILYLPASLEIVSEKESMFFVAIRQGILMFFITFPFCFGGAMGASILFPD